MIAHQLEQAEGKYTCKVCERTWNYEPSDECPGVKVYSWGKASGLLTKKQLGEAGYQTGKTLPAPAGAIWWSKEARWLWLYDPAQATKKRPVSEAQKAALDKAKAAAKAAWRCVECGDWLRRPGKDSLCDTCFDKWSSAKTAAGWLAKPDVVILDTETTGLHSAEIVEISIIRADGEVLLNTRIRPERPERLLKPDSETDLRAVDVHGITPEMLVDAPLFAEVYPMIVEAVRGKHVLIYNSAYDVGILRQQCVDAKVSPDLPWLDYDCVMELYAQYCGEIRWAKEGRGRWYSSYRWQTLPGADHSALGDCRATLDVLKRMARYLEKNAEVTR